MKKEFLLTKGFQVIMSVILGLLCVVFISPKVFLSSSPSFNPMLVQNMWDVARPIARLIPYINTTSPSVIFTETSKGVYAGEDKITKQKYIKFDKNVKVNVTKYTFEGKDIYLYEPEITPLLSPTPTK